MALTSFFAQTQLNILTEIGFIVVLATLLALLARAIKQPLIPAYILAGVLLGPLVLGLLHDTDLIRFMSELGMAFLLFVVGLEINISKLRQVGPISICAGFIEMALIFGITFLIATKLGFATTTALYLGLLLAFSSTMVVVKILSDMDHITTMHGRIIVGILLLQDVVALIALAALTSTETTISALLVFQILMRCLLLAGLAYLFAKMIFPWLFHFSAEQKELLFLTSVSTCLVFALLAYSLKFSIAIGAFLAGIALGTLPYSVDIRARVEGLKDFFATIFFVALGAQLVFTNFSRLVDPLLIFLAIVLILKPAVLFFITVLFGYTSSVAFFSGVSLAQTSEFSFILASIGVSNGTLSAEIFSLTILLTIASMVLTSYIMKHMARMHERGSFFLHWFEKLSLTKQELSYEAKRKKKNVIILGCNRMGTLLLKTLQQANQEVFVVDNNPEIIRRVIHKKIPCLYGDATSREVLESLNLKEAKIVFSTIPSLEVSTILTEYIRMNHPHIKVIVTVEHVSEAFTLYDLGADYVIVPHVVSGELMSTLLTDVIEKKKSLVSYKKEHLNMLESIEQFGLNHKH